MIQTQLKLKLNKTQETTLNQWLWHLTAVYNWAIRKIELDAKDKIYHSKFDIQYLLKKHSKKIGIPTVVIRGTALQAHNAWIRCFKKLAKKPHLKGKRNKLNSISIPEVFKRGDGRKMHIRGLQKIRYFKQLIPEGKIKCGRIIKRASGWYLCLVVDAQPKAIPYKDNKIIGIDPGYKHTLALSDGTKIETKKQFAAIQKRLGQAQRGRNKKLTARMHERAKNCRKDTLHKLSHKLTAECSEIYFSKDNIKGLAQKGFGKPVTESSHYQLRRYLSYKMPTSGRKYLEVASRNSTKTCSTCSSLTGPSGKRGLAVRQWTCGACGAPHDRDTNAAMNTLIAGFGTSLEKAAMSIRNLEGIHEFTALG